MSELYPLEEVHEHIAERLWLERIRGKQYPRNFYILPKRFSVEAISPEGKLLLPYELGKEYTLEEAVAELKRKVNRKRKEYGQKKI